MANDLTNMRGYHALVQVLYELQQDGQYSDEEGEETAALADLLAAIESSSSSAAAPPPAVAPSDEGPAFSTPYPLLNDLLNETWWMAKGRNNHDTVMAWGMALQLFLDSLAPTQPSAAGAVAEKALREIATLTNLTATPEQFARHLQRIASRALNRECITPDRNGADALPTLPNADLSKAWKAADDVCEWLNYEVSDKSPGLIKSVEALNEAMIRAEIRATSFAPSAAGAAEQAVPLTWVEVSFDKRYCHDEDGKVRGFVERAALYPRWNAFSEGMLGEYITEDFAKRSVERVVLAAPEAREPVKKYDDTLLPFLGLMRRELHANSSKGDRPGWLKMRRDVGLLEIYWHTAKLSAAVKNDDAALIAEHAADVANMAMMLLDVCGGIGSAIATPPSAAPGAAIAAREQEAGKALVPVEPTTAMMDAGLYQSSADATWADVYSMWKDMVAVSLQGAPAAPAQQDELTPLTSEQHNEAVTAGDLMAIAEEAGGARMAENVVQVTRSDIERIIELVKPWQAAFMSGDEGDPEEMARLIDECANDWEEFQKGGLNQCRDVWKESRKAAINYFIRSVMPAPLTPPFQLRVNQWMLACFGEIISGDKVERNHRFLEEALELVQACGCTVREAHQLVDYTFGRPWGQKEQEVGGVMVTLAALCLAQGVSMAGEGEVELARINSPEMLAKIAAKQAAKPKHSPLPEAP